MSSAVGPSRTFPSVVMVTWMPMYVLEGTRVDRHWDEMTESAVRDDVVVLGADDAIAGETEHIGNLTASKAGTNYDDII